MGCSVSSFSIFRLDDLTTVSENVTPDFFDDEVSFSTTFASDFRADFSGDFVVVASTATVASDLRVNRTSGSLRSVPPDFCGVRAGDFDRLLPRVPDGGLLAGELLAGDLERRRAGS